MKKLLIIPALAILVGCGGGGGSSSGKSGEGSMDLIKLLDGKTFYEASECKDPNYYTHKITKDGYIQKSYSDSDFTNKVGAKVYSIKTFTKEDLELTRDGIDYICDTSLEYDDSDNVSELGLDCHGDAEESEDVFFLAAYPTKELAVKNIDTDCQQ